MAMAPPVKARVCYYCFRHSVQTIVGEAEVVENRSSAELLRSHQFADFPVTLVDTAYTGTKMLDCPLEEGESGELALPVQAIRRWERCQFLFGSRLPVSPEVCRIHCKRWRRWVLSFHSRGKTSLLSLSQVPYYKFLQNFRVIYSLLEKIAIPDFLPPR